MEDYDLNHAEIQHGDLNKVVQSLIEGLVTDGAHHKQFALERALSLLCTKRWIDSAIEHYGWEEGIPG